MSDQVPHIKNWPSGSGVQIQRQEVPMSDQRPFARAKGVGGQGVQRQRDPDDVGPYNAGKLSSPFPYYGGKSRWIDTVFARIGKVGVWAEPLCGTAVMTLNNPFPAPREVICELNSYIANFYRALVGDYPQTAWYADWPTNHHDLTARHRWLLAQGPELRERMTADPDDFDPKIAGWWVWGQSSWIGHGWCDGTGWDQVPDMPAHGGHKGVAAQRRTHYPVEDKRPAIEPTTGGRGVQQQRDRVPGDQQPFACNKTGGQGVQQQRDQMPRDGMPRMPTKSDRQGVAAQRRTGPGAEPRDGIPYMGTHQGSKGVAIQRNGGAGNGTPAMPELVDPANGILDGSRLRPWFAAIAARLSRVIILNRSWESALTPSVLQQTPSSPKPSVGVFLDPPYRTTRADGGKRSTGLYQGDTAAASDDVAAATYRWAVEYGDKYRVAYCMHAGDFPIPSGWTAETMGFSGHRDAAKREKAVDQVIFSPACVPVPTDPQLGFGW